MKVGSLSDIQRQWSAKSKLEVFGQDFRHLSQCWRAMMGAYTGRRVLGGGPRCEVGAQVPSVAPCMFRCTWAGQAPQSSQSLRNPPGEGAGSVVVTAETLQRLRWGLPGAKTVSPVQYGVPLLGPSVVGGPVPHHGCGGRAHGEGQTSQTSKASVPPPDPRSPAWALPGVGSIGRAGCVLGALVRGRELPSTLASQSQPPCLLEVSPVRGWPCLARG